MIVLKIERVTKLKYYKNLKWYALHTDSYVVPYYDIKADSFQDWYVTRIWKDDNCRIHVDITFDYDTARLRRKDLCSILKK